jgi:hypothetical protein
MTHKKINEMNDEEFQAYIEDIRQQINAMSTEEALSFASHPIDSKDLGQYPTMYGEEDTYE